MFYAQSIGVDQDSRELLFIDNLGDTILIDGKGKTDDDFVVEYNCFTDEADLFTETMQINIVTTTYPAFATQESSMANYQCPNNVLDSSFLKTPKKSYFGHLVHDPDTRGRDIKWFKIYNPNGPLLIRTI